MLRWRMIIGGKVGTVYRAQGIGRHYYISQERSGKRRISCHDYTTGQKDLGAVGSLKAAKAKAQAHYNESVPELRQLFPIG